MLDLDLVKARLVVADSLEYGSYKKLLQHAAMDIEALVAEVERLRAAVERHRREALGVNILDEPALADQRLWREVLQ